MKTLAIMSEDGSIIPERSIAVIEHISDRTCKVFIYSTPGGDKNDFACLSYTVLGSAAQLADALAWQPVIIGKT
jgi:hypothetical protein